MAVAGLRCYILITKGEVEAGAMKSQTDKTPEAAGEVKKKTGRERQERQRLAAVLGSQPRLPVAYSTDVNAPVYEDMSELPFPCC